MVRPHKRRCVNGTPIAVLYKPSGIPARQLEWITLTLDEFETLRLLDHLGYDQEQAAEKMDVSRPTVTRIYRTARKKVADALVLGQGLRIEGGTVFAAPESQEIPAHRGGRGRGFRRRHGRDKKDESL